MCRCDCGRIELAYDFVRRGPPRDPERSCRRIRGCLVTTRRPDDRDEATEDEIRAALSRLDEVPQHVVERARNARAGVVPPGSCLLEIVYDSVLDASLGRFDPEESVRLMSFAGA